MTRSLQWPAAAGFYIKALLKGSALHIHTTRGIVHIRLARIVHIRLAALAACNFVPAAAGMPLVRQCNASVDIQGADAGASTPTISIASGIAAA